MAGISAKDIKNRIRSMEATRQITRAMELVAASKLRRAQEQLEHSLLFFQVLQQTLEEILEDHPDISSPFLKGSVSGHALYIVIAGDRGLAGGFNSNVLKLAAAKIQQTDALVLPIGRKAFEFFRSRQIPTLTERCFEVSDMDMPGCMELSEQICTGYLAGEYGQVYIAGTRYVSALSQVPNIQKRFPVTKGTANETRQRSCDTVYEPNAEDVLSAFVPVWLSGMLYRAVCESRACEAAARRTAMDSATQNADEMIHELGLKFNRARQAAITREITEIVAGS